MTRSKRYMYGLTAHEWGMTRSGISLHSSQVTTIYRVTDHHSLPPNWQIAIYYIGANPPAVLFVSGEYAIVAAKTSP